MFIVRSFLLEYINTYINSALFILGNVGTDVGMRSNSQIVLCARFNWANGAYFLLMSCDGEVSMGICSSSREESCRYYGQRS
jgi:hypothetical protein